MSPAVWARRQNSKNDTNCYNVEDSVIIIEKSDRRRYKSQPRNLKTPCLGVVDSGHCREKRNPLLDRVKHTRLSCFRSNSNVSTVVDVPSCSSSNAHCSDSQSLDLDLLGEKQYESLSRASCFTAKIRAMSEKYLQSSTNRFLNKLYKNQPRSLAESTPVKNLRRKKNLKTKLRSFSYGALPGLDEFQATESFCQDSSHILNDDDDNDDDDDDDEDRLILVDNEDSDSGIIVNDSALLSGQDSFYKLESLEMDKSINRRSYPQRALSLDRREIFKSCNSSMTESPPGLHKTTIMVRLIKNTSKEDLGVYLTRSREVFHGFLVAYIVPNGIAAR